jgi:hypothetical protein
LTANADVGPASRAKLLTCFQDTQKVILFKLELAAIIDWGKPFVTATYDLEGDGPLAFFCYEKIKAVVASIEVANTPNVDAVVRSLSSDVQSQQQLMAYAKSCVQPGLDYFLNQLQLSLKDSFEAFKSAVHTRINEEVHYKKRAVKRFRKTKPYITR